VWRVTPLTGESMTIQCGAHRPAGPGRGPSPHQTPSVVAPALPPGRAALPAAPYRVGSRLASFALVGHDEASGPYMDALHRGFAFARELGCACGPVHFLVAISEGRGPAAAAL